MAPSRASAVREGGGEASVGVHAGWAMEPRNQRFRVPTPLNEAEGNIIGRRFREPLADPARSKNLCMRGVSGRENREIPWLPAVVMAGRAAQGRPRPYA